MNIKPLPKLKIGSRFTFNSNTHQCSNLLCIGQFDVEDVTVGKVYAIEGNDDEEDELAGLFFIDDAGEENWAASKGGDLAECVVVVE